MNQFYLGFNKENMILTIDQELKKLHNVATHIKNYNLENVKSSFCLLLPFVAIPIILPPSFCLLTNCDYNKLVPFFYESIKYGHWLTIVESAFLLPIGTWISLTNHVLNRKNLHAEEAINFEIDRFQNDLLELKSCLSKLKEENFTTKGEEVLNCVDETGSFYYHVGYNYSKYLKYYQKGILRNKLHESYTEEQIEWIINLLEENGTTRIRKKGI